MVATFGGTDNRTGNGFGVFFLFLFVVFYGGSWTQPPTCTALNYSQPRSGHRGQVSVSVDSSQRH